MGFYRRGREGRREWRHRTKMYHDELLYVIIPYTLIVMALFWRAPEDCQGTWGQVLILSTVGLTCLGAVTVLADAWHEARYSDYETVCRRDYGMDAAFMEGRIERKLARRNLKFDKDRMGKEGRPHLVEFDPEDLDGTTWLLKLRRRRPSGGMPRTTVVLMTSTRDRGKVAEMEDLVDDIVLGSPDIHGGPPRLEEPPELVVYDD